MTLENLVSFGGILILLAVAMLLSRNRKAINYRTVLGGLGLQGLIALFVFIVPVGKELFLVINNVVVNILESSSAGTRFLFGRLAIGPGVTSESGESLGFFLAFQALPTIVFVAALVGALYHWGLMGFLIGSFSRLFTKLMRISGAESLCAASNIFVGVESTLVVRPYLGDMTRSELCTVLSVGMGTIASSMLAFYVLILQREFPTIAGHLVSASLLAAPGAVVMSKILYPETETPRTMGAVAELSYEKDNNTVEAIIRGASAGVRLVVGIGGTLLAFLGMVALFDLLLGTVGNPVNKLTGAEFEWSMKNLLGYLFYPFTLIIGVPPTDVSAIAKVIGERVVLTEVVSYQDLAHLIRAGLLKDPRSSVIAVYALCGFAHVASMAIFVGGATALAPHRIKDLSRIAFRALLAATLSCLLTGAWAGTFFTDRSIVLF